ncbi:hypothetical protein LPJ73_000437 [Coemansia sp. RSA 2703]|nr:hypothetical protein LPJ73_000437 [Coemansia sp. RSA 2703]KAJ2375673.1 hypothetical protein IW150_002417 [Coemansia sp. RSA 2607]KAJ2397072.1 hypothetical protein GGI05_000823 [Coemansia sp. RSA 2603]
MSSSLSVDACMPAEATDSPLHSHMVKRGHINVSATKNTSNIYYELYGTGPDKLVFINGMKADRQMWEPVVAKLLFRPRYQCLVYDHRGSGYSDSAGGPLSYTSSSMATDTKRLIDALGWHKVNVIGASMGGMVALTFACTYPETILTLTLVAAHAGMTIPPIRGTLRSLSASFISDPDKRWRRICSSLYPQEFLDLPPPPDIETSGCKNMLGYCAQVSARHKKYKKPMPFASLLGQLGVVFRHYVSPTKLKLLGKLFSNHQILIITGDQDLVVRPSNSAYIADTIGRDKVTFEVYEGTGHKLHVQQAHRLVQSIETMIARVCNLAIDQNE